MSRSSHPPWTGWHGEGSGSAGAWQWLRTDCPPDTRQSDSPPTATVLGLRTRTVLLFIFFYFFIIFRRFLTLFTILTAGFFSSPDHFREEASRASLQIFLLSESSFIFSSPEATPGEGGLFYSFIFFRRFPLPAGNITRRGPTVIPFNFTASQCVRDSASMLVVSSPGALRRSWTVAPPSWIL